MPAWKKLKQRINAELCMSRSGELGNFTCWLTCRMQIEAVPAHRLHDVEEHRSSQIGAEVDEHGQNHHGQAERLLVVFLQHGRAVPAPGRSR